jgi:hypothetical protein
MILILNTAALDFDNEFTDRLRAIPGVLDAGQGHRFRSAEAAVR